MRGHGVSALTIPLRANQASRKPFRLPNVAQDIVGIKLEPIVALPTSRIVGAEVLSVLKSPDKSEQFFQQQPAEQALTLLEAQIGALKNTPPFDNLFVNLPITLLIKATFFERLQALLTPGLNIEIVDPERFLTLPGILRERVVQRIAELQACRCPVWLDDMNEALIARFLSTRLTINGVKIDKMVFWRLRGTAALTQLVRRCANIAGHVLVEGIETERDRAYALQAGAGFGQGYYWPSYGWPNE